MLNTDSKPCTRFNNVSLRARLPFVLIKHIHPSHWGLGGGFNTWISRRRLWKLGKWFPIRATLVMNGQTEYCFCSYIDMKMSGLGETCISYQEILPTWLKMVYQSWVSSLHVRGLYLVPPIVLCRISSTDILSPPPNHHFIIFNCSTVQNFFIYKK